MYLNSKAANDTISGNLIGTDQSGDSNFGPDGLGNNGGGIWALEASFGDAIGGLNNQAAANTIANNGGYGIALGDSSTDNVHVAVDDNSMYANSYGGILLNGQDQTFCTGGMAYVQNTTPDDYTPCPLVLAATPDKVIGEACTGCTVEIYGAPNAYDDEGEQLLGTVKAGSCPASAPCLNFSPWTLASGKYLFALKQGEYITATSTSTTQPYYPEPTPAPTYTSETSSFSRDVPVGRTLVVNTTADSGGCPSGACSLRGAIAQANTDGAGDEIDFNIPSGQCSTTCTIKPSSAFPTLTAPSTFINGWTQPGSTPNSNSALTPGDNAKIPLLIDGIAAGTSNGFKFQSSYDSAEGLAVENFKADGFEIGGGTSGTAAFDIVAGSFIGTPDGIHRGPNLNGVDTESRSAFATIGGRAIMDDNDIAANKNFGVESSGPGGNTLRENLIGLNAADNGVLGNGYDGVLLFGTTLDTVGGIRPDESNVIGANFNDGIEALDTQQTVILQNDIGVDGKLDKVAAGNGFAGVFLYLGANNLVGDLPFGVGGNIISSNAADGVDVLAETGDVVTGNAIGLNKGNGVMVGDSTYVTGMARRIASNRFHLKIPRRAASIGGETPLVGSVSANIISGNTKQGILLGQLPTDGNVHVSMLSNSIFQNGSGGGIRFFGNTKSTCYEPEFGVNDGIACPEIQSATTSNVGGLSCDNCSVQIYTADDEKYDKGYGEGKVLLGTAIANSNGDFNLSIASQKLAKGTQVTATQTNLVPNSYQKLGNYYYETSQFAQDVALSSPPTVRRNGHADSARMTPKLLGNWKRNAKLIARAPKAWPNFHVRYRPLKP